MRILLPAIAAALLQLPATAPHHEANFDAERKQADELFLAEKYVDALPLYEDLCRQDPTIAVFAERHAVGFLNKELTVDDQEGRNKLHQQGIAELMRARKLGDNSSYVTTILSDETRNFLGAVITGVPLTVGYTYHGTAEAKIIFDQAEAAFRRRDFAGASPLYVKAATLDPTWYDAALYAGDMDFHLKDTANAGLWFAKAIAIDPDDSVAYRFWGDALLQAGDRDAARQEYVRAVVAEPYGASAIDALRRWAKLTNHQVAAPAITRPPFITPQGQLKIEPELAASTHDGRSSWILYQQYRVSHGARTLGQFIVAGASDKNAVITPSGYRHTIAEEHAALRAMLADVETNIKTGTLQESDLDPYIRNLRILEKDNVLGAWIAINAADAGIRSDYPEYRVKHRTHLARYVNNFLIQ